MSSDDLDRITHQLADVQRKLLDLPSDAFAERYHLQIQQDALRDEAARFHEDWDTQRSDADLLAELKALRSKLRAIDAQEINAASQVGGNPSAGAGDGGLGATVINQAMRSAQGAGDIQARIGRITGILEDRDVDIR